VPDKSLTTVTRQEEGRLPGKPLQQPLDANCFGRLATHWRGAGVRLSLWAGAGDRVCLDDAECPYWQALERSEPFRRIQAGHVAHYLSAPIGETAVAPGAASNPPFGALWPDLAMIAAPIKRRRRTIGVVLGCVQVSRVAGERFLRLCGACGLDARRMSQLAEAVTSWPCDRMDSLSGLLTLSAEQAALCDATDNELAILTQNLENTYEELNLVYRVSDEMGLPQSPIVLLKRVAAQVLEVSRARAIGFFLEPEEQPAAMAPVMGASAVAALADRVVQVGAGAPNLMELNRLVSALQLQAAPPHGYLVGNGAGQKDEFRWAATWLSHFVALPLQMGPRRQGAMLAINCRDEGDFTSVDLQLFRAVADRVTAFLENQRLYDELTDLLIGLLYAVVNSVDAKDPYTYGHSERVAYFGRALARAAGFVEMDYERIYLAGLLHDVGKIGVPDAILSKPGKLTKEEFDTLKLHPQIGVKILAPVAKTRDLLPGVLYHHERIDGRGYPAGFAGGGIPLLGRIICLADSFDAMTSNRTYRAALPVPLAIAEIRRCAGTQFDPALADQFLKLNLPDLFEQARAASGNEAAFRPLGVLNAALSGDFTGGPDVEPVKVLRTLLENV
jgi:HD-GYP domain-containing protein (c-di-GMP phosphodiesterase class II)